MKKGKLGGDIVCVEPHTHTLSFTQPVIVCLALLSHCCLLWPVLAPLPLLATGLVSTVRLPGLPDSTVQSSAAACQCVSRPLGSVQYRRASCCCFFFLSLFFSTTFLPPVFCFPFHCRGGISCFVFAVQTRTQLKKKKGPGLCVKCVPVVDSSILSHCGELAGKICVLNGCVCANGITDVIELSDLSLFTCSC